MSAPLTAGPFDSVARPAVSGWGRAAAVLAIVAVVAVVYLPTVRSLAREWQDFDGLTYSHGYLIVLISTWLIVRARSKLPQAVMADGRAVLLALAGASLLWLFGHRASVEILTQLLLPLIAWLAVLAVMGPGIARRIGFALAFIYFAIPIWDFGNGILQYITIKVVGLALTIAGIPAFVDGNLFHIPSGVFEIAGGCSGLHFFIVAIAIAALYGEIDEDSPKSRLQLLLLAAFLSMVCNCLRVFWIISVGYYTKMQDPLVSVSHYYFGWKVFAAMMVVFFTIARFMPATAAPPDVDVLPIEGARRSPLRILVVFAAVILGPLWALLSSGGRTYHPRTFALPAVVGGATADRTPSADWAPTFVGADVMDFATYRPGTPGVEVFSAIYFEQRQNKELVGYGSAIEGKLEVTRLERLSLPTGPFAEIEARDSAGRASLIWYYYEVGGWRTARGMSEQVYYGLRSLVRPPLSRVVAMRASCTPDCSAARVELEQLAPSLDAGLPPLR